MDDLIFQQLKDSKYYHPEITDVIYDFNQVNFFMINSMDIAEKGFDTIFDTTMFNYSWKIAFKDGMQFLENKVKEKNLKLRFIIEITKENLDYVKSLKYHDRRHLDDIKGNFSIFDSRAYMVYILHQKDELPLQTLWSNSKIFVEKQQMIFNKLWDIAIPLSTRIKELEYGINPYYQKTLTGYQDIQNEIIVSIEQTRKELLIFSSTDLLIRIIQNINFLKNISFTLKKDVNIRILIDNGNPIIIKLIKELNQYNKNNPIQFAYTNRLGSINELTIMTDRKLMLKIKFNSYGKADSLNNLIASVSNEEHKIAVQEILFEKFWNEIKNLPTITNSSK